MPKKTNQEDFNNHTAKNSNPTIDTKFYIFPSWRMFNTFPWQIWAVGWLAIFKAVLWLATDPNIPDPLAQILGTKFLIFMVPYVVFALGVWNLRKWGIWGLILLTVADLIIYLIYPQSSRYIIGDRFWLFSTVLLICNGPIGDVLILLASPAMLKHAGKNDQ